MLASTQSLGTYAARGSSLGPRPLLRPGALLVCPSPGMRKENPKRTLSFWVPPTLPSPSRGAAQRKNIPVPLLRAPLGSRRFCYLHSLHLSPDPRSSSELCLRWKKNHSLKIHSLGLPWWSSGKESALQCRGRGFDPWSGN